MSSHEQWRNPDKINSEESIPGKIMLRHTANDILKQAEIQSQSLEIKIFPAILLDAILFVRIISTGGFCRCGVL